LSPYKTVIIIAGPTAVGKTSVSIELAQKFNTEIISADSRQCYKELNIGVARPTPEKLSEITHHFIASHSIHQEVTAATFESCALEKTRELFNTKDVVIITGGTGLYLKAFTEGLDVIPQVPDHIRQQLNDSYKQNGLSWLQSEVEKTDPQFYSEGEIKNPHRLLRALEVTQFTGQSVMSFRTNKAKNRDFSILKIGLHLPKEQLHFNINERVAMMMKQGLTDEVKSLLSYQHLKALQTVGYKELFSYFNDEITLPIAIEEIKKNTRQYAKRQMTWFRKDKDYRWLPPDTDQVLQYLTTKLKI
jgi:tRNA dimethylallyltransferase